MWWTALWWSVYLHPSCCGFWQVAATYLINVSLPFCVVFILHHSDLFVLVLLYVLPYPAPLPSPKPLWAAAGLFCATHWVQVAEPKSDPGCLCFRCWVGWWGGAWEAGALQIYCQCIGEWQTPRWLSWNADWMSVSCICNSPPTPAPLRTLPPACTQTDRHSNLFSAFFYFFVCHHSPTPFFIFHFPVHTVLVFRQLVIEACLCLHLSFLASVTSFCFSFHICFTVHPDQYTNGNSRVCFWLANIFSLTEALSCFDLMKPAFMCLSVLCCNISSVFSAQSSMSPLSSIYQATSFYQGSLYLLCNGTQRRLMVMLLLYISTHTCFLPVFSHAGVFFMWVDKNCASLSSVAVCSVFVSLLPVDMKQHVHVFLSY